MPPPSTNGDAPPSSETGPTGTLRADCPGAMPHSPPRGTVPARPPIPPAGAVKVDGSSHRAGKLFGEGPSLAPNPLLWLCRGGSGLQPWAGGPAVALPGGLGAAQFRYWYRPRQGVSVTCITGPAIFSSKTTWGTRPVCLGARSGPSELLSSSAHQGPPEKHRETGRAGMRRGPGKSAPTWLRPWSNQAPGRQRVSWGPMFQERPRFWPLMNTTPFSQPFISRGEEVLGDHINHRT